MNVYIAYMMTLLALNNAFFLMVSIGMLSRNKISDKCTIVGQFLLRACMCYRQGSPCAHV